MVIPDTETQYLIANTNAIISVVSEEMYFFDDLHQAASFTGQPIEIILEHITSDYRNHPINGWVYTTRDQLTELLFILKNK